MHHLYLSIHNNAAALQQEREALVAWCEANGVKDYNFIEDDLTMGRTMEPNRTMSLFVNALNDIVVIEKDMKAYRSNEILFNMREVGVPIGRPKGSKKRADKNVLYGKEDTLRQLHSQGLSPAKNAAALGVSRGTVYNYIVENG